MTERTDAQQTPYKVILQTGAGDHVATASTLPFMYPPAVLVWGSRVFLQTPLRKKVADEFVQIYREDCPWTVLHTDEYGDVFPMREEK